MDIGRIARDGGLAARGIGFDLFVRWNNPWSANG
jgi:hypothetical protein